MRPLHCASVCSFVVVLLASNADTAQLPKTPTPRTRTFVNSLGMRFVRVEPGSFTMGATSTPLPWEILPVTGGRGDRLDSLREGDFDEKPVHTVTLTRAVYFGVVEVTNAQYELFAPGHRELRGKGGLSKEDDESVLYVNHYDATAFCHWLSDKEGLPYRLPTEAEWEYACRAGTDTPYSTGATLPRELLKNANEAKVPTPVPLHVGRTAPNAWGLYDMHGNVEEWCHDWYGPYRDGPRTDPVGYSDGEFRVTRGGSHSTLPYALRSANRQGALPETRNWIIGFRVVLGEPPATAALPPPPPPSHQQNVVARAPEAVRQGPPATEPYFRGPRKFVKIPVGTNGPIFASHNHGPGIVDCPNGDLLAVWFTCVSERNREMAQAASRLRWGSDEWEPASPFFDVPDRNDPTPTLWYDGEETIYYFTGISMAGNYSRLAVAMRKSTDSGRTWSRARLVMPDFTGEHQLSEPVFRLQSGAIAMGVDGPRSLWITHDQGLTWTNPGGRLPGNHPGIVQLADGRLLGYSRGGETAGMMTKSVSSDGGKTYACTASGFPPIDGGQRLVLLRLREGPLFFASFASTGTTIVDSNGQEREVRGLFGALSYDEGETWPHKRLLTHDGGARAFEGSGGGLFLLSTRNAEYQGYLSVCQSADGLIHLISSRQHYAFNLKYLQTPQPPAAPPLRVSAFVESFDGPEFDHSGWAQYKSYTGGFNDSGQYEIHSMARANGINTHVGAGSFEASVEVRDLRYHPRQKDTTPGFAIGLRDARTRRVFFRVEETVLRLEVMDEERDHRLRFDSPEEVRLSEAPRSAKIRLAYHEDDHRLRIFYGLNGAEAKTEFPRSAEGLRFGRPLSESTTLYLLVDQGSTALEHCEVRALR